MKNRFWSLYRSLLNVHYGWSAGKYYFLKKRQRIWEPILIAVSIAPVLVMAMVFTWYTSEKLFIAGLGFGQPHLALVYGSLLVSTVGLFFGFFYVLSAFYFSSDLAMLVPWPLRSWEILLAKLGVVLTGQYVMNAVVLLPLWISYGLLAQVGVEYIASAIIVFFTLPIIPLVLASLVTVFLMRFVNLSRHKDKLTLFGGIVLLIVVLGFQFWMQNSLGSDDPNIVLDQLLREADGLIVMVGKLFPPSIWAAQAMAYSHIGIGWLNLFKLIATSLLGLGVLYLIGEKVFMHGVIAGLEKSKGSRKKRRNDEIKSQSSFWRLTKMEISLFVRDPNFALNGLVGYVILPVMALLPLFGQRVENNPFELLQLDTLHPFLLVGGIALFFALMTAMSMIPSTTFSREGKYLWIIRSLPLSIEQLLTTRVMAAQIVNTIGCLLGLLPIAYLMGWGVGVVVLGSIFGILFSAAVAYPLVLFDLRRPMLDWVNPVKAVKSNLNSMIGMFAVMGITVALGFLFYLNITVQMLWLIPMELMFVIVVLGFLDFILVKRVAQKLWSRI